MKLQSRDSADSRDMVERPGSGKAAYSREFAMMMGLRDVGVTTTITAGREKQETSWRRRGWRRSGELWNGDNASQVSLKMGEGRMLEEGGSMMVGGKKPESETPMSLGGEWMGITKTTVIVTDQ